MASVALHVLLVAGTWWAHRQIEPRIEYVTYEIQMFSMAELEDMQDVTLQSEDLVVETPDEELPPEPEPEPPPPDPEPDPVVEPDPPPPVDEPPPQQEPPPERNEERTPPVSDPPPVQEEERTDAASSADIAVRMEGLQRDFPAYYRNILTQIQACHRWSGNSTWRTVVRFTITRDGRVPAGSIRLHERSGNTSFDLTAVGAIECAGAGRFGPLPDDLPWDELPVQFTFSPR